MTNAEILLLIKPVLNPELYTAIEAVFERESKLSEAASLIESALAKTPCVVKKSIDDQGIDLERTIDTMRSRPKHIWSEED